MFLFGLVMKNGVIDELCKKLAHPIEILSSLKRLVAAIEFCNHLLVLGIDLRNAS